MKRKRSSLIVAATITIGSIAGTGTASADHSVQLSNTGGIGPYQRVCYVTITDPSDKSLNQNYRTRLRDAANSVPANLNQFFPEVREHIDLMDTLQRKHTVGDRNYVGEWTEADRESFNEQQSLAADKLKDRGISEYEIKWFLPSNQSQIHDGVVSNFNYFITQDYAALYDERSSSSSSTAQKYSENVEAKKDQIEPYLQGPLSYWFKNRSEEFKDAIRKVDEMNFSEIASGLNSALGYESQRAVAQKCLAYIEEDSGQNNDGGVPGNGPVGSTPGSLGSI